MEVLETLADPEFPLKWAKTEYLRENDSFRKEIYLKDEDLLNGLLGLFYELFGSCKNEILVYQIQWWDMNLAAWDISTDTYNYEIDLKPDNVKAYLRMLDRSEIVKDYSGCCRCNDWDQFLPVVLRCVLSCEAPYGPLFVNTRDDFFFYFHHTGSIGIYYKDKENEVIREMLDKASELYEIKD